MLNNETLFNHCVVLCDNSTTDYGVEESQLSTAERAIRGVVILSISLSIVASNFINIVVLRGSKQIPAVAKIFLTNLGLTDLSLGVVTCLSSVIPGISGMWPYGAIWCQFSGILHGTTATVSVWTLSVVGVERYFAVIHPMKYRDKLSVKKCCTVITVLWLTSLAIYTAPNFTTAGMLYYQYNAQSAMCGMYWGNVWFCLGVSIFAPPLSSFTVVFTTVNITRALRKEKVDSTENTNGTVSIGQENRRKDKEKKPVRLIVATAMAFFAFWGPYVVVASCDVFGKVVIPAWLEFIVTWMGNANSFVNVIIYSCIYPAFRKEAKVLLWNTIRCQCFRKSGQRTGRRVGPNIMESTSHC